MTDTAEVAPSPSQENSVVAQKPLQVLLVEDNAGDARLLREMFSKEIPGSFELSHVTHMQQAELRLATGEIDIVLLDMGLPDGHGLETLRRARAAAPAVVMIVMTGLEDEALAAEAMRVGAQDYLIKGQIENRALPRALRHAMERQRMQHETDLMRSHQVQLRDEFLSHVSHELRSPLNSIYSFSTIIADGLAGYTTPQQDEYLQIVLRNVSQLQSMIEDLLDVGQSQVGKLSVDLQSTSVDEAIDYAVDTLQGAALEKEIALSYRSVGPIPPAYADKTRLRQILTILLDNAMKFTPAGGAVIVEARQYEKDPNLLLVEVSDNGCGIAPDATGRIFEHLYQVTDPGRSGRKGLGLGLHIAKELVTRQAGEIWVTSQPAQGSRFSFTVPAFSLVRLIQPILAHEKEPGEVIAVLSLEIDSRDGSPDVPRNVIEMVRLALQQCLRPDTDLLLPSMCAGPAQKLFFVVACTQLRGAEIIGKRILSQLHGHQELRSSDFLFAIPPAFLPDVTREPGQSIESFAEQVAVAVLDEVNGVCRKGES